MNFNTLKMFINLLSFTLLYKASVSFSDGVAKTTRTGKTRRRIYRSGKSSAKSNSRDSTMKTMRTWRISSTLILLLRNPKACNIVNKGLEQHEYLNLRNP